MFVVNPGDPTTPEDDELSCMPTGSSGTWNAISGPSDGWEHWSVTLPNTKSSTRNVEVSITYASDFSVQGGVALDNVVSSTRDGSTSFEADGNVLDGWAAPLAGPPGGADNPNTWTTATSLAAIPGLGAFAKASFARQPEILDAEADWFGEYPFKASGGIVDDAFVFFALENQTRPTYSPFFFSGGPNDSVVVHELAHQWFGDSLAVHAWQHIWLNGGLRAMRSGFGASARASGRRRRSSTHSSRSADDPFWELAIGDPGQSSSSTSRSMAAGR